MKAISNREPQRNRYRIRTDGFADHRARRTSGHHRVGTSAKVTKRLSKNEQRLRLVILPPYSPELNPDEFLNNDMKSNAGGRLRAKNHNEMMENLPFRLRQTQRYPVIIKSYFQAPSVKYAAA